MRVLPALATLIAMVVFSIAHATPALDPALRARLRALDCANVSASEVRDVLAHVPAPRIVLLQGSVPLVTMEPFARFLIAMGYPEERLRNPRDGEFSYSSFADSAALAGALAFDYEQSGMAPMLIGHSQGGMLAIKVLYEFAGAFHDALPVVDPSTGERLARTSIVDPRDGRLRPVVGLHVAYAAALATGWLPRLMLGQWNMLSRLRRIPDTVDDFTGFILPQDPIAGNLAGDTAYRAIGRAHVRSVTLPDGYHHLTLPRAAHLAADPAIRAWIDAWRPGSVSPPPDGDTSNLVHATDIWYSVKRHWCLQAQGLLSAPTS
ncbi:MAG TPA: hypothetical protein VN858_07035 [Casimicrobiaceae bacterium]|nr:hypothetical protein [Casimicrobiaceae bacterium]